jgi:predicted peptidase
MTRAGAVLVLLALVLLALTSLPRLARAAETGFLHRTVTLDGTTYKYQVYVPPQWSAERAWPVILFLHGSGERGDDGKKQTTTGLPAAIVRHPDRFPAVVVMPQCREKAHWNQPAMEAQALRALDDSIRAFHGDPRRLYLTGLSMGGFGTWNIAYRMASRFAALVPICGAITRRMDFPFQGVTFPAEGHADPYAELAKAIGKTPTWIFHGAKDDTVPINDSRRMARALEAAKGNVRYSELAGVGHDAWTPAYEDPELARWLFAQSL